MNVWQKIEPKDTPWQSDAGGQVKQLAPSLVYREIASGSDYALNEHSGTLMLVEQGELQIDSGTLLTTGDLVWVPADITSTLQSSAESRLFCLEIPGIPDTQLTIVKKADQTWEQFDDPAGRPTQPVQVLMDGQVSVLRTRFTPDYIAGEHWHDHPTWYFITDGNMRFGHEGWYQTGDIRQVTGGYSYGPEEPGEQGVEFVLVSVGGPVNLHWQDLEAAPNGALPEKTHL